MSDKETINVLAQNLICGDLVVNERGNELEVNGVNVNDDKVEVVLKLSSGGTIDAEYEIDEAIEVVA